MKILHISKYYSPVVGGIEDVCYNVVSILKEHHDQYVLAFNESSDTVKSIVDGIPVLRSGCLGVFASQPISFRVFWDLKKVLKSYNPDIVTLHLPNPLLYLYLLLLLDKSVKLVLHWHSDIVAQKFLYTFIKPFERSVLRRADTVIVTSPPYLEYSQALAPYKNKCVIVPNIISIDKMTLKDTDRVAEIKKQYNNRPIVFFMGRHVEYKGICHLIEAERYISSDCVILVAGNGPLTKTLKTQSNGKRIVFLGRINDEDIAPYMHAADILAFPSITKNEAFGVVLAEAMYCKTVPVTFNIPGSGVNWVSINSETGLEVENGNSQAYANAIDYLITNADSRKIMAENAYERVIQYFTSDSIKDMLYSVYTID